MTIQSVSDPAGRLDRLLGGPTLLLLRMRMRSYFERSDNGSGVNGVMQLVNLSPVESEALALLTGRPPRSRRSVRMDIAELDSALRAAGIADSLRSALEQLDGPIVNRKAIQAAIQSEWTYIFNHGYGHGGLKSWLEDPAAVTRVKRLSKQSPETGRRLLDCADAVLKRLPAKGIPRSQLAAQVLGNAHALDNREKTATIVLSVLRHTEGVAAETNGSLTAGTVDDIEQEEERNRDIWARAGVLVNELARPVLFLNLPIKGAGSVKGNPGEPAYASLRELTRTQPAWDVGGKTIFVCENPNLLAIVADTLGAASAPLISTDGQPSAAQQTLLTQLVKAGAQLLYHGDFDWPGLQIGNEVMRAWKAIPWRFSAKDYEASLSNQAYLRYRLDGAAVRASWDEALAPMMQRCDTAIAEEAVAEALLQDLDP